MHTRQLIFEDCTYVNADPFLRKQPMKKFWLTTARLVQIGECRVSLATMIL